MADKNAPAAKQEPKAPAVTVNQVTVEQQPAIDEHNPAADPNATAQERLDALTKQQAEMNPAEAGKPAE